MSDPMAIPMSAEVQAAHYDDMVQGLLAEREALADFHCAMMSRASGQHGDASDHPHNQHQFGPMINYWNMNDSEVTMCPLLPPIPIQALPTAAYLDTTVIPLVLAGLETLVEERPKDPIEYLAAFLISNNPQRDGLVHCQHPFLNNMMTVQTELTGE